MIGPVGPASIGLPHSVRRKPSGVLVPAEPRATETLDAGAPPVDTSRVATLRAAITDGRYTVDPQAIAERMIAADLSEK